jgi:error-prone DNA polymerase
MSQQTPVGPLPPCGGELERGVSRESGVCGLLPSLTLPRKGGGNEETA